MPKSMTTSDRSSHVSPTSVVTHSWAPPRAPLPPHRLAKLANALGVSTPVPATQPPSPSIPLSPSVTVPNTSASSTFSDHFRRSPTPSATSTQTYTPSLTSKFLLHVIPPTHLPHDSDSLDYLPPTASGYHSQFERGVLVPVYSTLPAQLAAIAKEYALPSTVGMILYLITSAHAATKPGTGLDAFADDDEPGPRISEDIWRHIWVRVLRSEKDESPNSFKPHHLGFGGAATQSSPSLLQDVANSALRPLISPIHAETPLTPLTPSPSSISHSVFSSQSELDTPESVTSVSGPLTDDLPLPGLHSPALIPVLAKVEFDIDRRRAPWYETWIRNRRTNQAKRAESRLESRLRTSGNDDDDNENEDRSRKAPIGLELIGRMHASGSNPSFLLSKHDTEEYAPLGESDDESDGDGEDPTERLGGESGDPLAEVFGSDAETWADLHAESQFKRPADPNVVDLALDGAALSALPDDPESERRKDNDEEEVMELLNRHSRPALSVSIPSSPKVNKRKSSPTTAGTIKKQPPPPLNLVLSLQNATLTVAGSALPSDGSSVQLAYLHECATPSSASSAGARSYLPADEQEDVEVTGDTSSEGELVEGVLAQDLRSPIDEKRGGVFYDELNLGLEPSLEFDDEDPHDRRKSQVLMMAQLDEIEKNLLQFSPRRLRTPEEIAHESPNLRATSLSPPSWKGMSPRLNVDQPTPPSERSSLPPTEAVSWPAVPYSSLSNMNNGSNRDAEEDGPPSPPRIAFNGVSTDLPKSLLQKKRAPSSGASDETLARKRELEEEHALLYPPLVAPFRNTKSDSPVIPLSPDPFGRFPSDPDFPPVQPASESQPPLPQADGPRPRKRSSTLRSIAHRNPSMATIAMSEAPSSRFSVDSIGSEETGNTNTPAKTPKTAPLMSVKSIKKLWRRTNKVSVSGTSSLPGSGRTSPNVMPMPNSAPNGQDHLAPMARSVSRSPQPEPMPKTAIMPLKTKRRPSVPSFQFNQESPYPVHPLRQPSPAVPPIPSTPPPLSVSPPPHTAEKNGSARKSILKSFKPNSGSLSASSSASSPPSSGEFHPDAFTKRHRPSVVDIAASMNRGSAVSSSVTLVDVPRSVVPPDQYQIPHSRSASRQSQMSVSSLKGKHMLASDDQHIAAAQWSRCAALVGESTGSFDESQFEIVSPKFAPSHTLTYPYHGLDTSMSSAE
ncbi:hypothetical protein A0H81_01286 [Grifola frondosa]|uniref:Uncharacterized protein n=1 Tax=Grifola frondosa TaxID=5627 RepID=A0A1C7MQQ6_GRIFR|nr:hypothetical protein A0H81_01286 [Grifola frondosa]